MFSYTLYNYRPILNYLDMPSLNELGKFRDSFSEIAGEKASIEGKGEVFDSFELPDTEGAPVDIAASKAKPLPGKTDTSSTEEDSSAEDDPFLSDDDIFDESVLPDNNLPKDSPAGGKIDGFDFSAFLGTTPGDLNSPPEEDDAEKAEISAFGDENADSSQDFEYEPFALGDESTENEPALSDEAFDFSSKNIDSKQDFGDEAFEFSDEAFEFSDDAFELSDGDATVDSKQEFSDEAFEFSDDAFELSDGDTTVDSKQNFAEEPFEFGDVPFDLSNTDTSPDSETDFTYDDARDNDARDNDAVEKRGLMQRAIQVRENTDLSQEDEGFDFGNEAFNLGEDTVSELDSGEAAFDIGDDAFDAFDVGSEDSASELDLGDVPFDIGDDTFNADGEDTAGDLDLGDISFDIGDDTFNTGENTDGDGFDSFNLGGEDTAPIDFGADKDEDSGETDFFIPGIDNLLSPDKPAEKKAAVVKVKEVDDIEEISLSQEELEALQETLAGYPLNLRIACQELIAEHVIPPDQLSALIKLLLKGASAKETAALAGKILDKPIKIPKGFEKSTGAELEAEQATFTYIFVRRFLPILWRFTMVAVLLACIGFLSYTFIYIPRSAETLYRQGYEQIFAGQYQRANELFWRAFNRHRNRNWFYRYAEAFIYVRRFMLAEEKYEALLRYFPRDERGVLDFARLQTNYLMNFERASQILRHHLLDFDPDNKRGLLALGDNYLAWADSNPLRYGDRYENARFAFARVMENHGWQPPVVERMLRYFIRTDNLREVIYLQHWFEADRRRRPLSAPALTELAGYLLDKQLERPQGVPNIYIGSIDGVRDMLLRAVRMDPTLPEPHYHLARYYGSFGSINIHEERVTLENAILAFDNAREESVRRRVMRIDAHRRYADVLVRHREFFAAEEQLIRGINLYEDFLARNLISPSPELGRLYADLGDLEFFTKSLICPITGDLSLENYRMALHFYHLSASHGWLPPEIQYRMGAAYYQLQDWENAMTHIFRASAEMPHNRRILFALGNVAFKRGDYFVAQAYFNRLLEILETQRARLPVLLPNDRPEFLETGERLMMARNNTGVVYEMLANQTGNTGHLSRALALYAESSSAWDSITRNPATMTRVTPFTPFEFGDEEPIAPSVNLPFLNARNAFDPARELPPQIFVSIDKDALEPSRWEALLPRLDN